MFDYSFFNAINYFCFCAVNEFGNGVINFLWITFKMELRVCENYLFLIWILVYLFFFLRVLNLNYQLQ